MTLDDLQKLTSERMKGVPITDIFRPLFWVFEVGGTVPEVMKTGSERMVPRMSISVHGPMLFLEGPGAILAGDTVLCSARKWSGVLQRLASQRVVITEILYENDLSLTVSLSEKFRMIVPRHSGSKNQPSVYDLHLGGGDHVHCAYDRSHLVIRFVSENTGERAVVAP